MLELLYMTVLACPEIRVSIGGERKLVWAGVLVHECLGVCGS